MPRLANFLTCLLLIPAVCAGEPPAFPKYLPPAFGTAIAQKDGKFLEITLKCPKVTMTAVAGVEDLTAPKLSTHENIQADVKPYIKKIILRGPEGTQRAETEVVDLKGKRLSHQQILQRLAKETPVLISTNRTMIEEYYLQTMKPDTLVLVLSYWDGAPATQLFPHFVQELPAADSAPKP